MVENCVPHQAFGVGCREPVEIVNQLGQHLGLQMQRLARIRGRPLLGDARDNHQALVSRGQRQMKTRCEMFEFLGQRHLIAHQNDGACHALVALGDVLEQPHVYRVFEVRMKVEQHIDPWHRRGAQML